MKKRIITGAVLLSVLVPLIMIDHIKYPIVGTLFLILGVFLSMVASYEMMNMFYTKYPTLKHYRYIIGIFNGLLVVTIHYSKNFYTSEYPYSIEILLLLFIISMIMLFSIFTKNSSAHEIMACIMTVAYCGLMFGYVINIRYLEPFDQNTLIYLRGGRSFGYLYSIVLATDTFAYLFGIKFGKRRLAPDISPKKSVEGAVAGLIGGSVIGVGVIFLLGIYNRSYNDSKELLIVIITGFFLSMFLSFMVQVGDLVASKIKRTYEIKDFGTIFPGHGGVIDRFDSLIYSGVAYYIIVQALFMIMNRWS